MNRARMSGLASAWIAPLIVASLAHAQPPPPNPGTVGPFADGAVIPVSVEALLKPTAPALDLKESVSTTPSVFSPQELARREARRIVREAWGPFHRGEHALAVAAFDEALRLDPSCAPAYSGRGVLRFKGRDFLGSLGDLDRAIELDHEDLTTRGWRAEALILADAPWTALDACSQDVARFPAKAAPLAARAWVRYRLRDPIAARADAERALEIEPGNAYATQVRMLTFANSGDDAAFLQVLDEAISRSPKNLENLLLRAELLAISADPQVRDPQGVLDDLRLTAILDGGSESRLSRRALRVRAAAHAALGDYPAALTDAWNALAHTGTSTNTDAGTDLVLLTHLLTRHPYVRRPRKEVPLVRGASTLYLMVAKPNWTGITLGLKINGACLVQVSFLPWLHTPLVAVGWNPRSDHDLGCKVGAFLEERPIGPLTGRRDH